MEALAQVLRGLQSADNMVRSEAEKHYSQAKVQDPASIIVGLVTIAGTGSVDAVTRDHAAVLLRRTLNRHGEKEFLFGKLSPQNQSQIASGLLQAFEAEADEKLQRRIGNCVAELAEFLCDTEVNSGGWPHFLETIFKMAQPAWQPKARESAIRLLQTALCSVKSDVVLVKEQVATIIQAALTDTALEVKVAGVLLVSEMVQELHSEDWKPLQSTLALLLQIVQQMAQQEKEKELNEVLEHFITTAGAEPSFFKPRLLDFVAAFAEIAKAKSQVQDSCRKLALEWLVSYHEKKPKVLLKSVPQFYQMIVEICLTMMLEIEDCQEELQAWVARMDDEEGDEDEDDVFHTAESAVDRLAEASEMDALRGVLFDSILRFVTMEQWQAKHAALATIRQTAEYLDETACVDKAAQVLIPLTDHPHPRVRYHCLWAIGQLGNDQAPHFQENWHKEVMPRLLLKMDDPIDRVASMSMSAFVSFGEELDHAIMMEYANTFMEKIVTRLASSSHRGVREECITSIAVIAGVIESDFSKYYDHIMPLLKRFLATATSEKEARLRGKAFECMSLLGAAVGKERFKPDADEAIKAMMSTNIAEDLLLREYIKEASERICEVLKKDFAPYLPFVLPGILASLNMAKDVEEIKDGEILDEDDEYVQFMHSEGKAMKVKTTKLEEMTQSLQLLSTFAGEVQAGYFDYVKDTAKAILPLISDGSGSNANSLETFLQNYEGLRDTAFLCWASLIKAARLGAMERSLPDTMSQELLKEFLSKVYTSMETDADCETLGSSAQGIAECIRNAGPDKLNPQECTELLKKMFEYIERSHERERKDKAAHKARKATKKMQDGELSEDEDLDDEEERACRRLLEEVIGALMETSPTTILPCVAEIAAKVGQWLAPGSDGDRLVAGDLACHIIQYLKGHGTPAWPAFLPVMIDQMHSKDAAERLQGAWIVNLGAEVPDFREYAPSAYQKLGQWMNLKAPKKKDAGRQALDNAVAALLRLIYYQADSCPAGLDAWGMVVARLPLKDDEEEGKKVHKMVVDLVLQQHPGILGQNNANLGKLLTTFAEIHKVPEISDQENDRKIATIFQKIPKEMLLQHRSHFNEKQQKKIESIISSAS